MNRRDALLSTGSMVLSASLGAIACGGGSAVAQNTPKTPKAPSGTAAPPPPAPAHAHAHGGDPALADAAQACLAKGQACIAHCLGMFAAGDTSMSGCAKAAHDMHAVMHALAAAASSGSKHLGALAKVAMEYCKDCEAECRKHAEKHAVCKECAEACSRTAAACQKVAA